MSKKNLNLSKRKNNIGYPIKKEIVTFRYLIELIGNSILQAQAKLDLNTFKKDRSSRNIFSENEKTSEQKNISYRYMFKESDLELKFDLITSNKLENNHKSKNDFENFNKSSESQYETSNLFVDPLQTKYRRKHLGRKASNAKIETKLSLSPPSSVSSESSKENSVNEQVKKPGK
ncbi:MAG: hypothetical protein BTN85_1197 [Candidatus Methanohalarchaeum thermophilum]|uniref:Uncharacterized protein n=1 Tax=Methanohalarchaeum thermophilum TaxID=1903181 RepID=A0A1Q6DWD6_METT1|nr:MAG: hypothetical protein BTN85_1197 [Candidatus Methanohalarchaeum thermophilum]